MSLSPPRLSLPGGACADVMPSPTIAFLWPCARPPRMAPTGGRALTVVSAGGGATIIYLVAWLHCMYLDCNGPSPAKKPGLSCAAKSPMVTIVNIVTVGYFSEKPGLSCAAKSPMVTNKKYSNHRILRYIGKSQMGKNGGKRVAACFSAPVPPRSVLQVRNGFETRGQHSSLLPLP